MNELNGLLELEQLIVRAHECSQAGKPLDADTLSGITLALKDLAQSVESGEGALSDGDREKLNSLLSIVVEMETGFSKKSEAIDKYLQSRLKSKAKSISEGESTKLQREQENT